MSRLSPDGRMERTLCRWALQHRRQEKRDPVRDREIFQKRCTGCHALNQNREGPRLHGVFGRISGQIAGFPYSQALVKAHIVWTDASLEQWLTDPDTLVPGNNMDFRVPNPQERQDLIRFLQDEAAAETE